MHKLMQNLARTAGFFAETSCILGEGGLLYEQSHNNYAFVSHASSSPHSAVLVAKTQLPSSQRCLTPRICNKGTNRLTALNEQRKKKKEKEIVTSLSQHELKFRFSNNCKHCFVPDYKINPGKFASPQMRVEPKW